MRYEMEKWVREEWCTDTRYYLLELKQDIFGQWLCYRQWKGLSHKSGRSLEMVVSTFEEAAQELAKQRKVRVQKGYRKVSQ